MRGGIVSVVGGSGFLGRETVRILSPLVDEIRILCRTALAADAFQRLGNVHFVPLDLAHGTAHTIKEAIQGSHAVVNMVGILHETSQQTFYEAHVHGTHELAQACLHANVARFVQISAIGADSRSDSQYASTKGDAEHVVRSVLGNVSWTVLRPSVIFGLGDSFLNRFEFLTRYQPFVPAIGGGKTKFQPVFVGDVAAAIVKAALSPSGEHVGVFELGGPHVYSFSQIMDLLGQTAGRRLIHVPIPFCIAEWEARLLQLFPNPLLTLDQVKMLRHDNVVSPSEKSFSDLSISPSSLEEFLPRYPWAKHSK